MSKTNYDQLGSFFGDYFLVSIGIFNFDFTNHFGPLLVKEKSVKLLRSRVFGNAHFMEQARNVFTPTE